MRVAICRRCRRGCSFCRRDLGRRILGRIVRRDDRLCGCRRRLRGDSLRWRCSWCSRSRHLRRRGCCGHRDGFGRGDHGGGLDVGRFRIGRSNRLDRQPGLRSNRLRGGRRNFGGLAGRGSSAGLLLRLRRLRVRGRGRHHRQHRLVALLEADIDDVILLFAERMHVDVADQLDVDPRTVAIDLLRDRGDVGRRHELGVGQIESESRLEQQRKFLLVQHGRHTGAVGQFENVAYEGRLHGRTHANRRTILRGFQSALLTQGAFRSAGALGEFPNHLLRQSRRRPLPAVRHQVDEDALARGHRVDSDLARQRQANGRAVGIAARRADVIRHGIGQLVDGNIDRPLEANHEDRAGNRDFGIDIVVEREHEAGKTVRRRKARLALDGLGVARARDDTCGQQENKTKHRIADAPKPSRAGTRLRPTSSGSRPRHSRSSLDSKPVTCALNADQAGL